MQQQNTPPPPHENREKCSHSLFLMIYFYSSENIKLKEEYICSHEKTYSLAYIKIKIIKLYFFAVRLHFYFFIFSPEHKCPLAQHWWLLVFCISCGPEHILHLNLFHGCLLRFGLFLYCGRTYAHTHYNHQRSCFHGWLWCGHHHIWNSCQ